MAFESHRLRGENYIRTSENFDREHAHFITPGSYHHYESRRDTRPTQPEPRFHRGEHIDDEPHMSYGRGFPRAPPHPHAAYPPNAHLDHGYQRHRKEMAPYYGTHHHHLHPHPPMMGLSQPHQDKLPGRAILPPPRPGTYQQEPFDESGGRRYHYPRRPSRPEIHNFRPRPREQYPGAHQDHMNMKEEMTQTSAGASTGTNTGRPLDSNGGANTPESSTLQDDSTSTSQLRPPTSSSKKENDDCESASVSASTNTTNTSTTVKTTPAIKHNDMLSDALLLASVASMARSEVKKISPSSSSEADADLNEGSVGVEENNNNSPSSSNSMNRDRNRTPSPQEFQNTTTVTPTVSTMPLSVKIVKSFQDIDSNKPLLQPKLSRDDSSDEGERAHRGPIQIAASRDQGDYHSAGSTASPSVHPQPFESMTARLSDGAPPLVGTSTGPQRQQHSLLPRKGSFGSYHDNEDDRDRVPVVYPVHRNPNPPLHPPHRQNDRSAPEGYFPRHPRPHRPMDPEQYIRQRPMYDEEIRYHHNPNHHNHPHPPTAEPPMYPYHPHPHYVRGGGEPGNFHPLPPYESRRPIPRDMHLHHSIDLRDRHIPMPRMIGPHHEDHGAYHYAHPPPHPVTSSAKNLRGKTILRRKCAWKNYPELEKFLIDNREEYLRHSAMNYTAEQKQFNNELTKKLLEVAEKYDYEFDPEDFNFVAIRDRIRCYYKSYVQNCKKRGIAVGYDTKGNKRQKVSSSSESTEGSSDIKTESTSSDGNNDVKTEGGKDDGEEKVPAAAAAEDDDSPQQQELQSQDKETCQDNPPPGCKEEETKKECSDVKQEA